MASVEKLPSGKWRPVARDSAGKKIPGLGTFGRKSDARERAVEAEAKARRRAPTQFAASAKMTWGQWWEHLAPTRDFDSDNGITESSIARNYLVPYWGEVPLNRITARAVRTWIREITPGRAPSYVRRIFALFQSTITVAVAEEVLDATPCVGIKLPSKRVATKAYTSPEATASLAAKMSAEYADALLVAFETGLRPGELAGLHTHRVDLDTGWLTVAETYVRSKKMIRAWPKNGRPRPVPLTIAAAEILARKLDSATRGSCGVPHTDGSRCTHDLVFRGPRGALLSPYTMNLVMRQASERAKTEPLSPYAVRRGFATRAGHSGLDAFELGEIMGHSDIKLTAGYVQSTPAMRDRFRAALGEQTGLSVVEDNVGQTDGQTWDKRGTDRDNSTPGDTPRATGTDE